MITVLQAQTPTRFQGIAWDRETSFPLMLMSVTGPLGGQHITSSQIHSAFVSALFPLSSFGARESTANLIPPTPCPDSSLEERQPCIALATHPTTKAHSVPRSGVWIAQGTRLDLPLGSFGTFELQCTRFHLFQASIWYWNPLNIQFSIHVA